LRIEPGDSLRHGAGTPVLVRDKGLGKTQLCVRFPTGTVTVPATES
jgi:hypothetical protein